MPGLPARGAENRQTVDRREIVIRTATARDLNAKLAPAAEEFYAASKFLQRFDLPRFCDLWRGLLESGTGTIILAEEDGAVDGAIGGVVYPEPYSGELVASEFFWFVRESSRGEGLRLYRAFEKWARDKGAVQIRMVHLHDSMPGKLSRVYERLGYTAVETHYVKGLKTW